MLAAPRSVALSRNRMSYISSKGLQNAPGENNCFLNCAVQVFWHLDIFRRSFRVLSGHACLGHSCIFCALKVIFTQFQYSDQSVLPPNSLRKALAEAFVDQQRFQLGLMDDAAECFENILTRLHFHTANKQTEDSCTAPHCLSHRKFALAVNEQIVCICGASTKPFPYNQMVLYVSAKALSKHAQRWMEEEGNFFDPSERFSELLGRAHGSEDLRACPSNCGKKVKIRRQLLNNPDIVSLGLIWETERPSFDYILDVSETIGTTLKLNEVYDGMVNDGVRAVDYQLTGLICYYGKHYSTFMRNSKSGAWLYFDDAAVQEVGRSFQDVVDKCCKSRYLPLLLFYVNPNGTVIDPSTAPSETVPVPGYVQRPKVNHDRTSSTELDPPVAPSGKVRRSVTPTPFTASYSNQSSPRGGASGGAHEPTVRRAITPGPDHAADKRSSPRDRRDGSRSRRATTEHQRQGSFLLAVSGHLEKTDIDYQDGADSKGGAARPQRSRSRSSRHGSNVSRSYDQLDGQKSAPLSDGKHPGRPSLVKDRVSRRDSNASSTSSSGLPSRHRSKTESQSSETESVSNDPAKNSPSHRGVNMALLNKASMVQRRESFKRGKDKKVRADVIRFVKSPSETSDVESVSGLSVSQVHRPNIPKSASNDDLLTTDGKVRSEYATARSIVAKMHQQLQQQQQQQRTEQKQPNQQKYAQQFHLPNYQQQPPQQLQQKAQTYQQPQQIYQQPQQIYHQPPQVYQQQPQIYQQPPQIYQEQPQIFQQQPRLPVRKALDDSFMAVHGGSTYVDNGFASLPRQKRAKAQQARAQHHTYMNYNDIDNQQGQLHHESSNPTKPVMVATSRVGNANENDYISRKAVESILKMQGQVPEKMAFKVGRTVHVKSATSPLKVNLEVASQASRDSGYKSGTSPSWSGSSPSWSGDTRHSTSSGGTTDSPPEHVPFPDPPSPRQLSQLGNNACPPTSRAGQIPQANTDRSVSSQSRHGAEFTLPDQPQQQQQFANVRQLPRSSGQEAEGVSSKYVSASSSQANGSYPYVRTQEQGRNQYETAPQQSGQAGLQNVQKQYGQSVHQRAPSHYGQPAQQAAPNHYGQPAQQAAPNHYGQPAQQSAPNNYGQPAQQAAPNHYGHSSQQAAPNQYGQSAKQFAPSQNGQQAVESSVNHYAQPSQLQGVSNNYRQQAPSQYGQSAPQTGAYQYGPSAQQQASNGNSAPQPGSAHYVLQPVPTHLHQPAPANSTQPAPPLYGQSQHQPPTSKSSYVSERIQAFEQTTHTAMSSVVPQKEQEDVCMIYCSQAEDLVSKSLQKEEQGDIHHAILYCTQAMVALKQAMDIPYVDYQSYIRAQMKHNTCIIRNKSLHKRLSSLDSSDGTLSGGNRSSVSSVSAVETGACTETLSRKSRSRSHSTSALNSDSAPDVRDGAELRLGRAPSFNAEAESVSAAKPSVSAKPSIKALKAKSEKQQNQAQFDIYGTLARKPKCKLTTSRSVPENLNAEMGDVVLRGRKAPPAPPVRRSSLVNADGENGATSPWLETQPGFADPRVPTLLLAPARGGQHARQASDMSEGLPLPPYPDVDQNEYMYHSPVALEQAELRIAENARWAIPSNDPGFCRRCHQNQYWIAETSTCLRCDVQKKPPKLNTTAPHYQHYSTQNTGVPISAAYEHPYQQYTVQYVTTHGNPTLNSKPHSMHYPASNQKLDRSNSCNSGTSHHSAYSPDEGIGLSSSDTTRQESTTESDMSESKRTVLELALRFDPSKLSRLNQRTTLQTFAPLPKPTVKQVSFCPDVVEPTPEDKQRKAGYDSDYDEDTSDSCTSANDANDAGPTVSVGAGSRCGLCQKRSVDPPAVYCRDCSSYMTRFQAAPAQTGKAETTTSSNTYSGRIKTV